MEILLLRLVQPRNKGEAEIGAARREGVIGLTVVGGRGEGGVNE